MKIASFDIFDTCLVRSCGAPSDIFDIVGARLYGNNCTKIRDFSNLRRKAERKARQESTSAEVTLDEIYLQFNRLSATPTDCDELISLERKVERENLCAVDSVRNLINEYRRKGYRIVFISDMYLDRGFLKSVLCRESMMQKGDGLFVSSESKQTKSTGSLYDYVRNSFDEKIEEWVHFGDNVHSDYKIARRCGIKARKISHPYTRCERLYADSKEIYDFGRGQIIASICRAVRLSMSDAPGAVFAADYVAPLYVPFVYDILQKAEKAGITDLYFIARDGCILYETAKCMASEFPDIAFHYLYLSRSSLYFPALDSAEDVATIINWRFAENQTPAKVIANYTGLDISGIKHLQNLSLKNLLGNEEFRVLLKDHHAVERQKLLRYFKESGLASGHGNRAIVDLRGTGKTQRMINRLLSSNGYRVVKAFYMELQSNRIPQTDDAAYYAVITNERYFGSDRLMLEAAMPLESLYSVANHPRTVGYRLNLNTERIEPVFEEESNLSQNVTIYETNLAVLRQWCRFYLSTRAYHSNDYNLLIGLSLLKRLINEPEYNALELMSKIVVSETGMEKSFMVQKLSPLQILCGTTGNLSWYTGCFSYTFGHLGTLALRTLRKLSKIRSIISNR